MSNAIEINGLNKYYGKLHAVKDLSINIKEGEFLGFLGPNGAGKTTTINIITGLSNYKHGTVKVFGNDIVKDYRAARRLIGLVPQEMNLDFFFTAKEILIFSGGYFGMHRKQASERADELLKQMGIYDKKDNYVRQLSGGQKRRLLIARAIMHNPKLLILDEPTAGVDVELRRSLWKLLENLNKKGMTIVLTTHYIEEAERLANRIAIINHGKIIELDEKNALIDRLHKKTISIKLRKSIRKIPRELEKFSPKLIGNDSIRITCDSDCDVGSIIDIVYKSNIEIKDLDIEKGKLEDIFVEVTGLDKKNDDIGGNSNV